MLSEATRVSSMGCDEASIVYLTSTSLCQLHYFGGIARAFKRLGGAEQNEVGKMPSQRRIRA